jgi:hypothetical protein
MRFLVINASVKLNCNQRQSVVCSVCFVVYLATLSASQTAERREVDWVANDELKRMLEEAVLTQFEVLSQHYPGGTKENHK